MRSNAMAVCAYNLALSDLFFEGFQAHTAVYHIANVPNLLASDVIEVKNNPIVIFAIDARMAFLVCLNKGFELFTICPSVSHRSLFQLFAIFRVMLAATYSLLLFSLCHKCLS